MSLAKRRVEFSVCVADLVNKARQIGFYPALDEVKRTDEQACINALGETGRIALAKVVEGAFPALALAVSNNGKSRGIMESVHRSGLAVDLILYKLVDTEFVWVTDASEYEALGKWWEEQHPDARWGGRFNDANHFSFEYQGRK